mmetsp:Transcript_53405/g.168056  ORF Transcript_53405/g.168056 Transcript_53405/m.168056 type:complete len:236 (-) Transcript_53405:12-719(-)
MLLKRSVVGNQHRLLEDGPGDALENGGREVFLDPCIEHQEQVSLALNQPRPAAEARKEHLVHGIRVVVDQVAPRLFEELQTFGAPFYIVADFLHEPRRLVLVLSVLYGHDHLGHNLPHKLVPLRDNSAPGRWNNPRLARAHRHLSSCGAARHGDALAAHGVVLPRSAAMATVALPPALPGVGVRVTVREEGAAGSGARRQRPWPVVRRHGGTRHQQAARRCSLACPGGGLCAEMA